MDVPYVNPFGSEGNYTKVELNPNTWQQINYIGQDNREANRLSSGQTWTMKVPWTDKTTDPYDDLRQYLSDLGADLYRAPSEEWVAHVRDAGGTDWWCRSTREAAGYSLWVCRELSLKPDVAVSFKTFDMKDRSVYFMTTRAGNAYLTLLAGIPAGEVVLTGTAHYEKGSYKRNVDYRKQLYAYKTNAYVLDDIPQESFAPILWKATWTADKDPGELTFTVTSGPDVLPVRYGEELGALKVKGVSFGKVTIEPLRQVNSTHPECPSISNYRGDITPEGDTIFWLPSGYWNLHFEPNSHETVRYCVSRLVPVSSGELTTLTVPPAINEAYVDHEMAQAGAGESGLKILDAVESGTQVTVTFQLLDSKNMDLVAALGNTVITEGGQPGKLIRVDRVKTLASVALLLDSSGSMKDQMAQTIAAAKTFVLGLPANTRIQVVDFDTVPRLLKGTTAKEALAGLATIKANGATALNDSIMQGLDMLKDQQRPTLVVFTDGMDEGSKATRTQVMAAVKKSGVPLFTIGFGVAPDSATLLEFAGVSGGMYYPAQDKTALDQVFAAILKKLGNMYTALYERPTNAAPTDVPVISMVLDTSASMDKDPSDPICNWRIDKVKAMYHGFIAKLPDPSLVQLMRFSDWLSIEQISTTRKADLLQALGSLEASSGTDILMATTAAYEAIRTVPSNKRVIIFMTDAALKVPPASTDTFERLLVKIKEAGIRSLWVGLGVEESKDAFAWAASKSGGRYVISENAAVLGAALDQVLAEVKAIPAKKLTLAVSVKNTTGKGTAASYSASRLVDFPIPPQSGSAVNLEAMTFETGAPFRQYDKDTSALLTGMNLPGSTAVQITKRIPLNVSGSNRAMTWKALDAYSLTKLGSITAPSRKSFLAIDMEMTNVLASAIPYSIPDVASHVFIGLNGRGSYPASTATWLTATPLMPPGESGLTIQPGKTAKGMLVFIVPDERMEQAELHYYDTSYGHITLPLVGTPVVPDSKIETMPTGVAGKLSDTFTMTLSGAKDLTKIGQVQLPATSLFRVVEGVLESKRQAILNISPMERFQLRLETRSGTFFLPIHPATALVSYGFLRPVSLAPGTTNPIRFVFQIPTALKTTQMSVFGDLHGGALELAVGTGSVSGIPSNGPVFSGTGVKLTVNAVAPIQKFENQGGSLVVADLTVSDMPDGTGTTGLSGGFTLVREGTDKKEKVLRPDAVNDILLLGISGSWPVYDGSSRRGLIVFRLPAGLEKEAWTLQSPYFTTLKQPISATAYKEPGLMACLAQERYDDYFDKQLAAAVQESILAWQSRLAANPQSGSLQTLGVQDVQQQAMNVPVPRFTVEGDLRVAEVTTLAQFQVLMQGLSWLPSEDDRGLYRYAPEAVVTQGWGTESDLSRLAGGLLSKLGYHPVLRTVQVTSQGKQALMKVAGLDSLKLTAVPAWTYTDDAGNARVFVVPFMRDLANLGGLAFLPGTQEKREQLPQTCDVSVYVSVLPLTKGSVTGVTGGIGSAMGGAESAGPDAPQQVRVLTTRLGLDACSLDAMDIYFSGTTNAGYTVRMDIGGTSLIGDHTVDVNQFRVVSTRVEVRLDGKVLQHDTLMPEGADLSGFFQSLAINLPDLPEKSADTLRKAATNARAAATSPDVPSALRWYTRSILSSFVAQQTVNDAETASQLGITVGRTSNARCLIVTVRKTTADSPLQTNIDLMQSLDKVLRGTDEAKSAFRIATGLFASRLEGMVLPGNKLDFMDVWQAVPSGTKLHMFMPEYRVETVKYLKSIQAPAALVSAANKTTRVLVVTDKPATVNGSEHWAWLEIDPVTFETISVLDDGSRGGMAEYVEVSLTPGAKDFRNFAIGAFLGTQDAIWSVATFTLQLSDYAQILKMAESFTFKVGKVLDAFLTLESSTGIKFEEEMGPVKVEVTLDINTMAKEFSDMLAGKRPEIKQNVINFIQGYEAGAGFYFKMASKALAKKTEH
ncbi:MAG: VWA domain-containing protein [Caldiserica bacterium]|nr:VWA domain-containing protein [Caldisericota bacterium]